MTIAPLSRREENLRRFAGLAETARAWVEAHPPGAAFADPRTAPLVHAVESAESQARLGEIHAATRALDSLIPRLLEQAEREGIDLDAARPRARVMVDRTLASATLAEAYRIARDLSGSERFRAALEAFQQGEAALSRLDHASAGDSFRRTTAILETILRDRTLAALEERLRALRRRRGRVVDVLRTLPACVFAQRQRADAIGTMRRLDQALANGDEERAEALLAECETLVEDPTATAAKPAVSPRPGGSPLEPRRPWWVLVVVLLGCFLAIVGGLALLDLDAGPLLERIAAFGKTPAGE